MSEAVCVGGKTIRELGEGLRTVCKIDPQKMVPEIRTQDNWQTFRFWFTRRGDDGQPVYLGYVDHIFTSREELGAQWDEWVQASKEAG